MCYDVTSGLKALIKYAKHRHDHPDYIRSLEKQLEKWLTTMQAYYYVSGYAHPQLMVFTNEKPNEAQFFNWGLIPYWTKDLVQAKQLANQTLNARAETIFEKPAFRNSAKYKRCLVYLDGFYEYHHANNKTYPFLISNKNEEPMAMAGLWDEWIDKDSGEIFKTVSIVTTKANTLMGKIHNNPKLEEPRMPVILPKEKQDEWLMPFENENDQQKLLNLLVPNDSHLLTFHTVQKLKGKGALGNVPQTTQIYNYEDLDKELKAIKTDLEK
jgi:putative SOS response-associated peptidase YedK